MNTLFNIIKNTIIILLNINLYRFFIDNQYCPSVTSVLFDNKTMIFWRKIFKEVIDDFENIGYNFNYIAEMNIITIANKMDMSYDFYIRH